MQEKNIGSEKESFQNLLAFPVCVEASVLSAYKFLDACSAPVVFYNKYKEHI